MINVIKNSIFMLLIITSAKIAAQTLPVPTTRGISNIERSESGFTLLEETLQGRPVLIRQDDIPFDIIKDGRTGLYLSTMQCVNIIHSKRCIADIKTSDKKTEIWLLERPNISEKWHVQKLPIIRTGMVEIGSKASFNFSTDAPLSYLDRSPDAPVFSMVVAKDKINEKYVFENFDFAANEVVLLRPVQSSQEIMALAGIVFAKPNNRNYRIDNSEAVAMFTRSKGFLRIKLPDDCILIGAINDKIMCVSKSGQRHDNIDIGDGISFAYIDEPENAHLDLVGQNAETPYIAVGKYVIIYAFYEGIMRPVIWNSETGQSKWLDISSGEACFANLNHPVNPAHLKIYGATSNEDAVLVSQTNLTQPNSIIIAPFFDGKVDLCSSEARSLYKQPANFNVSGIKVERHSSTTKYIAQDGLLPPYVLLSSDHKGPLNGKLLIMSYGVYGSALDELYLGAWGKYWVEQGGSFAVAHLPGGGGYGNAWAKKGEGILGKFEAAKSLNRLAQFLKSSGHGEAGISLYSYSAGGPIIAYTASISPKDYDAVILHAACLELNWRQRARCTREPASYGDINDPNDRRDIIRFNNFEALAASPDAPLFIFGIPQYDTLVSRDIQLAGAERIIPERKLITHLPGVNHTQRLPKDEEEKWAKQIVDAIIADSGEPGK